MNLWNPHVDCLSWWRACHNLRRVQLAWHRTPDTSTDDSGRWQVRNHLVRSLTPIHIPWAYRPTWKIPAGQCGCGIPHAETCYHVTLEQSSDFNHYRWPPKSPDMYITEYIWDILQCTAQKTSPFPSTLLYRDCRAGFMMRIASQISSDIIWVYATSCCGTSAYSRSPTRY